MPGRHSEIRTPGAAVGIESNSPRISDGAVVLGIKGVDMGRTPGQINHDDRLVGGTRAEGFFSLEQLR